MAHNRPRRKCTSVSFVGDDDVVQHIVDIEDSKKGSKRRQSNQRLKYKHDTRDDIESSSDEDTCTPQLPVVEEEDVKTGSDVFQFKTTKKSGQMAQKAFESRTPKSILKNSTNNSQTTTDCKTPTKEQKQTQKSSVKNATNKTPGKTPDRKSSRQTKRIAATTPHRLRKRNLIDDSDSESSLSSDNSSENEEEEDSVENTPKSTSRSRSRPQETMDMPTMVEGYFDLHSAAGFGLTSDRTLSKLGTSKMDQESLNNVLKKLPENHGKECKQIYQENRCLFRQWMFHMCNGFNILLYGLGSKRELLEDFRRTFIKDFSHIVVNGYFPSLTIKHILNTITEEMLDSNDSYRSPLDQVEFIKKELEKDYRDFYIILHNIDGSMLRGDKSQNILSLLSQIPGIHVVASIDHINAMLVWDQSKCSRYNWLWYDVTTFMSYVDETSYENSLLVQQSGSLALSSMTHVLKSLTSNAKSIFLLLCKYQLERKDDNTYIGMPLDDLYQRCREGFFVNSDLTLRAQLIEFRDHKLIKSKQSYDGIEHLLIPIDSPTLTEFVEQQDQL